MNRKQKIFLFIMFLILNIVSTTLVITNYELVITSIVLTFTTIYDFVLGCMIVDWFWNYLGNGKD